MLFTHLLRVALVYLLGVTSGHWDYLLNHPKSDIASRKDIERLNRGIAIITPIKHVMEILMYDELKERRKKDEEKVRMENAATLDMAMDGSEEDVFTKDDFEEALKKVVKTSDKESLET